MRLGCDAYSHQYLCMWPLWIINKYYLILQLLLINASGVIMRLGILYMKGNGSYPYINSKYGTITEMYNFRYYIVSFLCSLVQVERWDIHFVIKFIYLSVCLINLQPIPFLHRGFGMAIHQQEESSLEEIQSVDDQEDTQAIILGKKINVQVFLCYHLRVTCSCKIMQTSGWHRSLFHNFISLVGLRHSNNKISEKWSFDIFGLEALESRSLWL